eukprot:Plantae.Rhodophyta-Hildenbrandia_rubra.ctg28959.p1 GENE.Plantae.Rhodophyta-Hildenbrandia_rubra.ctg28959~~Plantae.Rhodophyta-Hildenbrandia_rubra.ctg28959.p1  ORF type:complete len:142 (+),score=30.27 Plantae.Rhodophyta-Hildenbrandia_rubra.ctg28959:942-1367(+)
MPITSLLATPPSRKGDMQKPKAKKSRMKQLNAPLSGWDESCAEAFEALKKGLASAPALAFPDYSMIFTLAADASELGAGCALPQEDKKGNLRAAAHGSHEFAGAELSMMPEKELYALPMLIEHSSHICMEPSFAGRQMRKL